MARHTSVADNISMYLLLVAVLSLPVHAVPAYAGHRTQGPGLCDTLSNDMKEQIGRIESGPLFRRGSSADIRVPGLNPSPPISATVRTVYMGGAVTSGGPNWVEVGWKWNTQDIGHINSDGTRGADPDLRPTVFLTVMRDGRYTVTEGSGSAPWGTLAVRNAPYRFRIRQNPDGDNIHEYRILRDGSDLLNPNGNNFHNSYMSTGYSYATIEAFSRCDSMRADFSELKTCQNTAAASYCEWRPWAGASNAVEDRSKWWYVQTYATTTEFTTEHCNVAYCPDRYSDGEFYKPYPGGANCDEEYGGSGPCWSEWIRHEGAIESGLDAASWGEGRLDVFARGAQNELLHRWFDGAEWSPGGFGGGWQSLGAPATLLGTGMMSDPAAVSSDPNRIDVFARGIDNMLWITSWNGSIWSGWSSLGAPVAVPAVGALPIGITSSPDAASDAAGWIHVFVRGPDNALWTRFRSPAGWSDWTSPVAGAIASDPSAIATEANRFRLFARGTGGDMLTASWDGAAWSGWTSLGGGFRSGPDAASWRAGRADVFATGLDGALYQSTWAGSGWSGWTTLSGSWSADPGAVSWGQDHIDVFGRSADGAMFQKYCDPC